MVAKSIRVAPKPNCRPVGGLLFLPFLPACLRWECPHLPLLLDVLVEFTRQTDRQTGGRPSGAPTPVLPGLCWELGRGSLRLHAVFWGRKTGWVGSLHVFCFLSAWVRGDDSLRHNRL